MKLPAMALAVSCLLPLPALAQTTQTSGTPVPSQDADLSIQADVHMDSIRFDTVPDNAQLHVGGLNERGGYTITRYGIPVHPKAGVTYRNVRIVLNLNLRFTDPKSQALYDSLKGSALKQTQP